MIYHNLETIKSGFNLDCIDKKTLIACPHCKAQYLAGEIFMPGALIGRPEDVVKDSLGKLIYVEYSDETKPNMLEQFTCDYCNKPFIIEATVAYKTLCEAPEKDFSTEYVPLLD